MDSKLPTDIQNLVLHYRKYVERNSEILRELVNIFLRQTLRICDTNRVEAEKDLNHIMRANKLKGYFEASNKITLFQFEESISDKVIEELILYFLLEKDEEDNMIFFDNDDWALYIGKVNNLLKKFNSRLRVIPYTNKENEVKINIE